MKTILGKKLGMTQIFTEHRSDSGNSSRSRPSDGNTDQNR